MATQAIGLGGNIASGSLLSSFKYGVFDEVTDAIEIGTFVTRTASDPNPGSHRAESRHMFCQDGNPVRESGRLNLVYHPMEP
jgi:hypothetical protein